VSIPQLGDGGDGVEASILGQCVRHDLEGLGELPEAVLLHARQRVGVFGEAN